MQPYHTIATLDPRTKAIAIAHRRRFETEDAARDAARARCKRSRKPVMIRWHGRDVYDKELVFCIEVIEPVSLLAEALHAFMEARVAEGMTPEQAAHAWRERD